MGYNTTQNNTDPDVIFSAAFEQLNEQGILPFNSLQVSGDGLEDDDYIETAHFDEEVGGTVLDAYVYYVGEGWYDLQKGYSLIDDTVGLKLGESAWYMSSTPKTVTTAGQVYSQDFKIHTFVEPDTLVASAYPVPFCPNSANVSWAIGDDTYIETSRFDEEVGGTMLDPYVYYNGEGWYTPGYQLMAPTDSLAAPGVGFWLMLSEDPAECSFTEVSPLAKDL